MKRSPLVHATLHNYASIESMLKSLPYAHRDERLAGDGASILQRVVQASGRDNETQLRIRMPGITADKKPKTDLYIVTIAAPISDVVMQLNSAGAVFDPLRPTQNGFMKATRYNYDVA